MTTGEVYFSGMGCVCAAGVGMRAVEESLRSGSDGIRPVDLFSVEGCRNSTAGQLPADLASLAAAIHAPAARWSRAAQVFLIAAAEALNQRPGFVPDLVIVGTTSGAMDLGEKFFHAVAQNRRVTHAARMVRGYPPQAPVLQALEVLGLRAPVRILSNACASGTNALGAAWQEVRSGRATRVLAGGYDTLSQLVFAGFDCLQASTPERCRPFDAGRSGLVLGEGAAVFCIESEGPIRMAGYGSASDNHHLTQPHPSGSGPECAMRRALSAARIHPEQIGHVNAHGTGTPQNDACEAKAIGNLCPAASVTSTKAITGHALGAAGALEAAFSAICLQGQFLPPTLNFRSPDEGVLLDIVANQSRQEAIQTVISNSFGFGGANASLVLALP